MQPLLKKTMQKEKQVFSMKLKFKIQPYQTAAVESVVDCFAGQPRLSGMSYRMDPGTNPKNKRYRLRGEEYRACPFTGGAA